MLEKIKENYKFKNNLKILIITGIFSLTQKLYVKYLLFHIHEVCNGLYKFRKNHFCNYIKIKTITSIKLKKINHMIISIGSGKKIWKNPIPFHDKNSQQIREVPQPDKGHPQKT